MQPIWNILQLLNVCVAKNAVPAREIGRSVTGDAALIATAFFLFSMRVILLCFFRFDNERFFVLFTNRHKEEHLRVWGAA